MSTRSADTVSQVEQALRLRLAAGEFAPGERLPEARLARRLGVSRTPVREAMRRLVSAGILEHEPNQAPRVPNPSAAELGQLYDLRRLLDAYACERAAATATAAQLARLDAAADAFQAVQARVQARELTTMAAVLDVLTPVEREFHEALAAAANHPWLERMLAQSDLLGAVFSRVARRRSIADLPARLQRSVERHRYIAARIRAGDGAAVSDFVHRMMVETRDREVALLQELEAEAAPCGDR